MSAERARTVTICEAPDASSVSPLRPTARSENAVAQARLQIVVSTPADFVSLTLTHKGAFDLAVALLEFFGVIGDVEIEDDETPDEPEIA